MSSPWRISIANITTLNILEDISKKNGILKTSTMQLESSDNTDAND